MYCELNNAYDTDLFQSSCAKFTSDDGSDNYHPKNIFTTQGDFKDFSETSCDYPSGFSGTPIDMIRSESQPEKRHDGSIIENIDVNCKKSSPPIAMETNTTDLAEIKPIPKIDVKQNTKKTIQMEQDDEIKEKDDIDTEEELEEEVVVKPKTKLHRKISKHSNEMNSFFIGLRETMFILLIGIIIIFLMDILIRIGKKL